MSKNNRQLPINIITEPSFSKTIWSIGHGAKPIDVFIGKLREHRIDRVVDARSKPYSRWHPQYCKNQLAYSLAEADINYHWFGNRIGGLMQNTDYEGAVEWLAKRSEFENIAILCSESDYKKCHRYSVIMPDLNKRRIDMFHIV